MKTTLIKSFSCRSLLPVANQCLDTAAGGLSLTPGFSQVFNRRPEQETVFNGLPRLGIGKLPRREAVETAPAAPLTPYTGLKPGVNETPPQTDLRPFLPWVQTRGHNNRPRGAETILHRMRTTLGYLILIALLGTSARAADRQVLPGHVPQAVAKLNLQATGRLPATNRLRLAIGLPLRNTNDLERLLQDMYDPASPQFRHYVTLEQFTERFGPTRADYEALKRFAVQHGLEVTATHPNRVVLDVAGPVSGIEDALQVKLRVYQHPTEQRTFYAPDVEPSVEAGLAVLDISGLNNYAGPRSASRAGVSSTSPYSFAGSGTGGDYMGKDFRNAYAPGVGLTGAGQIVGLMEFGAYSAADVTTYEDTAGLPHVPLQHILLDGAPATSGEANYEANVDIDMAVSMAPGLTKVVIFDGGSNEAGVWNDILNCMATNTQIKQLSSSWWVSEATHATSDQIFKEMALQGQSFFTAAGDGDSWNDDPLAAYVNWPCDDPCVTSVGGTTLTMTGDGAAYASERVWNDGFWLNYDDSAGQGTGGGISTVYPIPPWQKGLDMSANHGSTTMRNYPDVSIVAENFAMVLNGSVRTGCTGASYAAPLWAGFTALINEEAAANGEPVVGFLNPALYALGQNPNYTNCFHDITTGNNDAGPVAPLLFPAVPGYDLCTGWGTPTGSNLIHALAFPQRLGIAPGSPLAFTNSIGGAVSPASLAFTLTNQVGSLAWAVGQDVPWVGLSPTNGTLVAGGPATAVTVAPNPLAGNLTAGGYTANLYFTNLSDQSVVARQVTLAMAGPPVITSQPTNLTLIEGMSASFSVGTASNALLTYQWQFKIGSSVTNLTDGGNISGSASNVLTITNISWSDAGTYSVMVSNLAGSVPSAWASLTVFKGQPPVIVTQPSNQSLLPGAAASFTVVAAGDPPLSYSWQLNGTSLTNGGNVSGSSGSTLEITGTTPANAGNYSVLIINGFGSVTSTVAALDVPAVTTPGAALETFYSFTSNAFGIYPWGGLLQAKDGHFHGTARAGGSDGWGTVFRCATNGVASLVYAFTNGNDGAEPLGGLIQGANGQLYGTASQGGQTGAGTVFRTTTSGSLTGYSLNSASSGSFPYAALVQGKDGNFYGTANIGGQWGNGAVFRMTPGGALTALGTFNSEDGANPYSTLIQASDGNFYGTTAYGGADADFGTIFRITSAGILTTLFSFGYTNGYGPGAALTQDTDGSFYGTTYKGGAYDAGTVFKFAKDGAFTSLYSFTGGNDGSDCYAGLLLASDGNLYGATGGGGAYGLGTVFRISRQGVLTTVAHFDGWQGATPQGTLIQAADGKLYGTTVFGGASGFGAIYRLTLPMFLANPFTQVVATAGAPYAASLPTNAVQPTGDALTFAKVAGPAWLNVAANGALSGTPAVSDIGTNSFSVSLADTNGWSSTATMTIAVVPAPPIVLAISGQGQNLVLSWVGGQPPYQVQMATGLNNPSWQNVGGPVSANTLLLTPSNAAAFYRIQGQ